MRIAKLELAGTGSSFQIIAGGRRLGEVTLRVPGRHNALNAAAATTVGLGLDLPFAEFAAGLTVFTGARRRFEPKGVVNGVRVYDDYAHHPTEIAAILRAAREVVGSGRLVVAFQAHHYYRTADFCAEFGQALGLADEVVVMEVYAPGETMLPGGTGTATRGGCHIAARTRGLRTVMVCSTGATSRTCATRRSRVDDGRRGRCRHARAGSTRGVATTCADASTLAVTA